jgi:hypothetical protein
MALLDFLNPLNAITDGIVKWQIAKENAKNDSERIKAEQNIAQLEAKRDLAIAATVNDRWWSPRVLVGWIIVIFLAKVFLIDTVLGLSVTPYPGALVMEITSIVIAFYFGVEGLKYIGNGIAAIGTRRH